MTNSRALTRPWTPDEEDRLRILLDAGKTAAEIAVELRRTRDAIYGRVQRFCRHRDAKNAQRDLKRPTWGIKSSQR
jgi:hypothetical protein